MAGHAIRAQWGTLEERFWRSVRRTPECWDWTGRIDARGYGRCSDSRRTLLAHRVAWTMLRGPIPPGTCVLHHCDRPICVRPDHLFLGTVADNVRDMCAKGRAATGDRNGSRLHPERLIRGEKFWSSRLTPNRVRMIRTLFAAGGWSKRLLAREFRVHPTTITNVVERKDWKHV